MMKQIVLHNDESELTKIWLYDNHLFYTKNIKAVSDVS